MHPPLLGPAVWGPCAAELTAAGHRVAVPDLRAACDPPAGWPERAAAAATAGLSPAGGTATAGMSPAGGTATAGAGGTVVAGHSGAGVLLPLIADRLGAPRRGRLRGRAGARRRRRHRAVGPVPRLPRRAAAHRRPAAALDPVVGPGRAGPRRPRPAAAVRHRGRGTPADARVLRRAGAGAGASWPPARVGYLQLSPAYDGDAAEAAARGWPVRSLAGQHLDLATRPTEVAAEIVALAGG